MPRTLTRAPKPWWKTCLIGMGIACGTGLVLLVGVGLILYGRATARPPGFAQSVPAAPTTSPAVPVEPPPPLEAQVEQIEEAVRAGRPPPSLRLTESQINDYIARNTGSAAGLHDPHVTIRERDLVLTARTEWGGRRVYLTVTGTPQATDGRVGIRIDELKVGNLTMPAAAVARVQAELDRAMAEASRDQGIRITDVTIADRQLIVSGSTAPR